MFFMAARYPAVVMKKAPHCVGLFLWAGFGEGGGTGGRKTLFAARERVFLPPENSLCQNFQTSLMHARPAVDAGRRVALEVGDKDQRDAAGGQLVQQIQILAAGVFI